MAMLNNQMVTSRNREICVPYMYMVFSCLLFFVFADVCCGLNLRLIQESQFATTYPRVFFILKYIIWVCLERELTPLI